MKKYMDKFKRNIKINKNLFVFLLCLTIVGFVSGALFSVILNADDRTLVNEYLNNFFTNVRNNKLDYSNSITNAFVFNFGCAIVIWLLGLSIIGFFIALFILFLKGFVIGFSVGSIISLFKFKGIILALVYIFPHHIFNILTFMLLVAYSLLVSYKIFCSLKNKKIIDFKILMRKYCSILIISLIIFCMTSVYEIYGVPKVLAFILALLK